MYDQGSIKSLATEVLGSWLLKKADSSLSDNLQVSQSRN